MDHTDALMTTYLHLRILLDDPVSLHSPICDCPPAFLPAGYGSSSHPPVLPHTRSYSHPFPSPMQLLPLLLLPILATSFTPTITSPLSPSSSLKTSTLQGTSLSAVTGLKRVVITGYGITSCLGNTVDDVQKSLETAKSGITFSQEYKDLGIKANVRGRPDLEEKDFKELIPKSSLRFMGMNAKYAYVAMQRAIEMSGLPEETYSNNPRVAGILGQGGTSILVSASAERATC